MIDQEQIDNWNRSKPQPESGARPAASTTGDGAMGDTEIILVRELLENTKAAVARNHEREPLYSRLLREQIRLEDRLRALMEQGAAK